MSRNLLVGNAGEYFVMAELLRCGWIAGLTPRNTPDIDILAINNGQEVRIRCKTKSKQYAGWQFNAKGGPSVA